MTVEHFSPRSFALKTRFGLILLFGLLLSFSCAALTNRPAVGPGITYEHNEIPDVPWSIHLVKVERARANLQFETTMGAGKELGMGLVSDQLKTIPPDVGRVLAAINGDFYNFENQKYAGDPKGLQIAHGELVSAPDEGRSCFWIDAAGNPRITNIQSRFTVAFPGGRQAPIGLNEERKDGSMVLFTRTFGSSTRTSGGTEIVIKRSAATTNWLPLAVGKTYSGEVQEIRGQGNSPLTNDTIVLSVHPKVASQVAGLKQGDVVTISTATTPEIEGSATAIGGGPALIHGKKIMKFEQFLQRRDPRTALGWNNTHYFLVVVDGRQKNSVGMTFPELAAAMQKLGCDEAINLDGGGSATLWVYGHVMNSPSEGRERPAANALVVVRKEPAR